MISRSIEVRGLRLEALVGVGGSERSRRQPIQIDIVVKVADGAVDIATGLMVDEIDQTVNYVDVIDVAKSAVAGPSRKLIETIAEQICRGVIELNMVDSVEVLVSKLIPPIDELISHTSARVVLHKE